MHKLKKGWKETLEIEYTLVYDFFFFPNFKYTPIEPLQNAYEKTSLEPKGFLSFPMWWEELKIVGKLLFSLAFRTFIEENV